MLKLLRFSLRAYSEIQGCDRLIEGDDGLMHLLAGANGDAHTATATGIAGAVAHQDAGDSHQAHKLRVLRADIYEDEVGAAGPAAKTCCINRNFKVRSRGEHFTDIPI
jgi:hypothetical protein